MVLDSSYRYLLRFFSRYCASPLPVWRVIWGNERFHPKPKGPLPAPAVGSAASFSPMPGITPAPLGMEIEAAACRCPLSLRLVILPSKAIWGTLHCYRRLPGRALASTWPPNSQLSRGFLTLITFRSAPMLCFAGFCSVAAIDDSTNHMSCICHQSIRSSWRAVSIFLLWHKTVLATVWDGHAGAAQSWLLAVCA